MLLLKIHALTAFMIQSACHMVECLFPCVQVDGPEAYTCILIIIFTCETPKGFDEVWSFKARHTPSQD